MKSIKVKSSAERATELLADPEAYFENVRREAQKIVRNPTYERRGNWRRIACSWWGHEYITTSELLWASDRILCLRCYASAGRYPHFGHAE